MRLCDCAPSLTPLLATLMMTALYLTAPTWTKYFFNLYIFRPAAGHPCGGRVLRSRYIQRLVCKDSQITGPIEDFPCKVRPAELLKGICACASLLLPGTAQREGGAFRNSIGQFNWMLFRLGEGERLSCKHSNTICQHKILSLGQSKSHTL